MTLEPSYAHACELWRRRAVAAEAALAEARDALEKISGAGAWDAAHIAGEALAAIVRAEEQ